MCIRDRYKVLHEVVNVTLTLALCTLISRLEELGNLKTENVYVIIELLNISVLQEYLRIDEGSQKYLSRQFVPVK